MKWLVYFSKIHYQGKGEPYSSSSLLGYSDKNEKELFTILEKEYPNYSVLKLIKYKSKEYGYDYDYYTKVGGKVDSPYEDYVYFTSNNLKEF